MENFGILLSLPARTTEPMSTPPAVPPARAEARRFGDELQVALSGRWKITEERPQWRDIVLGSKNGAPHGEVSVGKNGALPKRVKLALDNVEHWDSSLPLFVLEARRWCEAAGAQLDESALPPRGRALLEQIVKATPACEAASERAPGLFTATGLMTGHLLKQVRVISNFVGEVTLGLLGLVKRPDKFRWRDCLGEMQQCGAMALPIVGLIGLLVGLTLAYTAAVLLRQFGADIYVSDFVGLVMAREMGPVMTAIVLAGRTGAAFAATIGNMKANEEIDALETLGLKAVEFLALPRMIALALMMPLLTLYANVLGMIGGMIVALGILEIPPTAYWVEMQTAVGLSDVGSGLVKSATFGLIVGLSGCLRGLQAERSAAGVGQAATSAVVTAILLIIVADSLYAVIFNILGW